MEQWNGTVEWNSEMEQWNGTVEWDSRMEQWNGTVEWTRMNRLKSRSLRSFHWFSAFIPSLDRSFYHSKLQNPVEWKGNWSRGMERELEFTSNYSEQLWFRKKFKRNDCNTRKNGRKLHLFNKFKLWWIFVLTKAGSESWHSRVTVLW